MLVVYCRFRWAQQAGQPAPGLLRLLPVTGLLLWAVASAALLLPFGPGAGKAGGASASATAAAEGAAAACWAACCEPCGSTLSRRKRTGHSAADPLLRLAASRIACGRDRAASPNGMCIGPDHGSCRALWLGACFRRGYFCVT